MGKIRSILTLVLISSLSFSNNGSFSIGTLSNFGDGSDDFKSGCNIAFKVPLDKTCNVLNKKVNFTFGATFSSISKENDNTTSFNSFGLHMTPELNFPIDIDFGLGYGVLSEASGNDVITGSFGLGYKLPSCNCSVVFEYRQTLANITSDPSIESFACYSLGFKFGG